MIHNTFLVYFPFPNFLNAGSLANAVGSLYVTKYFNEDSKTEALMMVSEIRCLHFPSSLCNNTSSPTGDNLNGSLMKWTGWTRTPRDKPGMSTNIL